MCAPDVQCHAREARRGVAGVRHDAQCESGSVLIEPEVLSIYCLQRKDLLGNLLLHLWRRAPCCPAARAGAAARAAARLLFLFLVGHGAPGAPRALAAIRAAGRSLLANDGAPSHGRARQQRCAPMRPVKRVARVNVAIFSCVRAACGFPGPLAAG